MAGSGVPLEDTISVLHLQPRKSEHGSRNAQHVQRFLPAREEYLDDGPAESSIGGQTAIASTHVYEEEDEHYMKLLMDCTRVNESKDKSTLPERGLPPRGKGKLRKARLRKSKDNEYVELSSCEMLSHVVGSVGEGRRRQRGRGSAQGLQEASISTSTSKFMPNSDL